MKFFFTLVLVVFIFSGCGYRPASKFAREVVGEKISTSVVISQEDPQNTVIIKDAVDKAIVEVFRASLVSKEFSDTHLTMNISKPSYSPIVYDEHGYVTAYRMSIALNIKRESKKDNSIKTYSTRGSYDFNIQANSIVSDQQRFEAINVASQRAINAFVAKVSADGARRPQELPKEESAEE